MTSKSLGALIALAASLFVAWQLGGAAGSGVVVGYTAAALATLGLLAWQQRLLLAAPRRLMQAVAASLLLKLCLLLSGALLLRFVDGLAAVADWRAYLIAFAATSVLVLVPGTIEILRPSKASRAL